MKKTLLNILALATLFFASTSNAQVGVGLPAENIHPSAELEVKSTTKGFLPPRMTKAERDAIVTPAAGLLIYQTDGDLNNTAGLYFYDGAAWKNGAGATGAVGSAGATGAAGKDGNVEFQNFKVSTTSDTLYLTNGNYVIIPGISLSNPPTSGFGPALVDIDGNSYKTVYIGKQLWMAENLKVSKYNDGTIIKQYSFDPVPNTVGAWSNYYSSVTYDATFGKLYNWYVVSPITDGNKNVCPIGWHVPTDAEWTILTEYLGGEFVAGGKMKEIGTTNWNSPNSSATNISLFTGLPAGFQDQNGFYNSIKSIGFWWSASDSTTDSAWIRILDSNTGGVLRISESKRWGFSIRCLKD